MQEVDTRGGAAARRRIIAAVIAVAVVAVLAAKAFGASAARRLQVAAGAPPSIAEMAAAAGDPYPATPAEQMAWVRRYAVPTLVLFRSATCSSCNEVVGLIAKVRPDYAQDIAFIDVIVAERANRELVTQIKVRYVPTTLFVDSHGRAWQEIGVISEETLRARLEALRTER